MLPIFSCFHGDLFSREKQNWVENLYRKVPAALLTRPKGGNKPNVHQLMNRQTKDVLLCLAAQSCLTLCDPMDCSPPGSSVQEDSPGKNTGVGSLFLLQGNFPTQGLNQGLLRCRRILYQLSYQGIPPPIPRCLENTCGSKKWILAW